MSATLLNRLAELEKEIKNLRKQLGDIQRPRVQFVRGSALLENFPHEKEHATCDDEVSEQLGWR